MIDFFHRTKEPQDIQFHQDHWDDQGPPSHPNPSSYQRQGFAEEFKEKKTKHHLKSFSASSSSSSLSLSFYQDKEEEKRQHSLYLARHHFAKHEYHFAQSFLAPFLQEAQESQKEGNPDICYMWGCCLYNQGNLKESIKYLQKAIELDPHHGSAKTVLSILLNDLGQYQEAKGLFQDLQKQKRRPLSKYLLSPSFKRKLLIKHDELAHIYFDCQQYEEAISCWIQSMPFIALGKQLHDITLKLCSCYFYLGKGKAKIKDLLQQSYAHPLANEEVKEQIHLYLLQIERGLLPCKKT